MGQQPLKESENLFRRIQMVEACGRGILLIFKHATDVGFQEVGNLFIFTFNRPSFSEQQDGALKGDSLKSALFCVENQQRSS